MLHLFHPRPPPVFKNLHFLFSDRLNFPALKVPLNSRSRFHLESAKAVGRQQTPAPRPTARSPSRATPPVFSAFLSSHPPAPRSPPPSSSGNSLPPPRRLRGNPSLHPAEPPYLPLSAELLGAPPAPPGRAPSPRLPLRSLPPHRRGAETAALRPPPHLGSGDPAVHPWGAVGAEPGGRAPTRDLPAGGGSEAQRWLFPSRCAEWWGCNGGLVD